MLFGLSACAIEPSSIVKTPKTARPIESEATIANNGSIYKVAAYRPLFEDRRPRYVGDLITINIIEKTSADKAGKNAGSKNGSVDTAVSALFGHNSPKGTFNADNKLSNDDSATSSASNNFTGTISATVIEVLPNGNLVVAGEKQVALDRGTEFVRISGVVNPDTIAQGNVVPSSKVADARIEYRTNTQLDVAQVLSVISRFFLSLGPL